MTDARLAEQIVYYRRRAAEYDATAYGDPSGGGVRQRIERIVAGLPPASHALEIACGTGMWTSALDGSVGKLVALDAAPEALAIARSRCPETVEFVEADIFAWRTERRFDLIFFAFWLSHVPADRRPAFFAALQGLLKPGGVIAFVDEPAGQAGKETPVEPGIVRRELTDGTAHLVVKHYLDPGALVRELEAAGWRAQTRLDGADWFVGSCRRDPAREAGSA